MFITGLIIGACIATFISIIVLKPKSDLKNQEIEKEYQQLLNDKYDIQTEYEEIKYKLYAVQQEIDTANKTYDNLQVSIAVNNAKKEELLSSIQSLKEQAEQSANVFYENSYNIASLNFERAAEEMAENSRRNREEYLAEYLTTMEEAAKEYNNTIVNKKEELVLLTQKLEEMRELVSAAVEANLRKQQEKDKENFYRLVLSEQDLNEIKKLREIIPLLKDPEALNKVIWTIYYQKPYTDLIGRVFQGKRPSGIYKITNVENGMVYVGQAACVPERWSQHIKRGLGAEPITRNKLYPAMIATGVENFTFELIEECPREKLNEREQFWQDYFHAKTFGYSIK